MNDERLTRLHLDVYDSRCGPWNPEHGEVQIPDDWEFLPSGDAFVTRTVKSAGVYWLSWRPRGRNRPYRRLLGLWAPKSTIEAARARSEETAEVRRHQRHQNAAYRQRQEERYRSQLKAAIVEFLGFAAPHADIAEEIARAAADRAAVVGSGRVGRTRMLSLEDRAALAARAYIRHHFTDYEDVLDELARQDIWDDDFLYRHAKQAAHDAVDDFLDRHRATSS